MFGIYDEGKLLAKFVAPTSVVSNRPVFSTDALSLKRSISKRSAQRWEITSNLEPLSHGANELFALFTVKGHFEPVTVRIPQNFGVISRILAVRTIGPDPQPVGITAAAATGDTSITVDTTLLSTQHVIPKGTFIKSSTHSKVYMLTEDLRKTTTSVGIYPAALSTFSGTLHYRNVEMQCYLDSNVITGMAYTDGILMDIGSITLVEKL